MALRKQAGYTEAILSLSRQPPSLAKREETIYADYRPSLLLSVAGSERPDLLQRPDSLADLWEPHWLALNTEWEMLRNRVEHDPSRGLSIMTLDRPMSLRALNSVAQERLILTQQPLQQGGTTYQAWVRVRNAWGYEPVDAASARWTSLESAALALQCRERLAGSRARWHTEYYGSLIWKVECKNSCLDPQSVADTLFDQSQAPPESYRRSTTWQQRLGRRGAWPWPTAVSRRLSDLRCWRLESTKCWPIWTALSEIQRSSVWKVPNFA